MAASTERNGWFGPLFISYFILVVILMVDDTFAGVETTNLDTMPSFKETTCQGKTQADMCIAVSFSNGARDTLVLNRASKASSIYEGFLQGARDIPAVVIDIPMRNKRFIKFNSENVPHCANFDVDLTTNTVKCIAAGFNVKNEIHRENLTSVQVRDTDCCVQADTCCTGPIVPLGSYYESPGIPLHVLYTFDAKFYNEFNGKDGKSGDEHMEEVMALTKAAYLDATLKANLGTAVNIIGTKRRYKKSFTVSTYMTENPVLINLAHSGGNYDVFVFVGYRADTEASGIAWGATVCSPHNRKRLNFNSAYRSQDCNVYSPPTYIDCTPTNRIVLTSETIAHEVGHVLGMAHDFDQEKYNQGITKYRKYQSDPSDCRGLMDYVDDGVGWSKCSARDFSRYITYGGRRKPCLAERNPTAKCRNKFSANKCEKLKRWGQCGYNWVTKKCLASCGSCLGNVWWDKKCWRNRSKCRTNKNVKKFCKKTCRWF